MRELFECQDCDAIFVVTVIESQEEVSFCPCCSSSKIESVDSE